MSQVPAFCSNCGLVFPSRVLSISNSRNITIGDSKEPCINCGSVARVPDGVYNFIGETIELLSGPERTVQELNRLAEILSLSKEKNSTYEEVMEEVKEEVPQMTSLLNMVLPKTPEQFYSFVTVILSIITLLVGLNNDDEKVENKQPIEVNQVVNYIYENNTPTGTSIDNKQTTYTPSGNKKTDYNQKRLRVSKPLKPKNSTIKIENKIGRNEPCYCNSGKKYKRCHGQ